VIKVYEIHRYHNDTFQYVVARTIKYPENKIRDDVLKMNAMLSDELKEQGIRYIFALGSISDLVKKHSRKERPATII
jgi:hypothetical protein